MCSSSHRFVRQIIGFHGFMFPICSCSKTHHLSTTFHYPICRRRLCTLTIRWPFTNHARTIHPKQGPTNIWIDHNNQWANGRSGPGFFLRSCPPLFGPGESRGKNYFDIFFCLKKIDPYSLGVKKNFWSAREHLITCTYYPNVPSKEIVAKQSSRKPAPRSFPTPFSIDNTQGLS